MLFSRKGLPEPEPESAADAAHTVETLFNVLEREE
jgi:hypothetical protein